MTITRTLKRNPDGTYTANDGWEIRKHCDNGRWVIINPETGTVFDSSEKLSVLRDTYGTPRRRAMPTDADYLAALGPCGK